MPAYLLATKISLFVLSVFSFPQIFFLRPTGAARFHTAGIVLHTPIGRNERENLFEEKMVLIGRVGDINIGFALPPRVSIIGL
jgi:hypothetical protein